VTMGAGERASSQLWEIWGVGRQSSWREDCGEGTVDAMGCREFKGNMKVRRSGAP